MTSTRSTDRPAGTLKWRVIQILTLSLALSFIWVSCWELWLRRVPAHVPVAASGVASGPAADSTLGAPPYPKGRLGKPMGTVVTIRGVVGENRLKAEAGPPLLDVRTIDGVVLEQELHILLAPYFLEWGETYGNGKEPLTLRIGDSFELEGYETGGFVGIPVDAYERAGVVLQTAGFGFRHEFRGFDGRAIDALPMVSVGTDRLDTTRQR